MIIKFLDWFIDYWVMLNYVFYKFYARRESDPQIRGLIYAPGWVWFNIIEIIFLLDILFDCRILSTLMGNNKYLCILPFPPVLLLNYLFLYRKDRWKDIFKQIDKERDDTKEVKRRYRNTVIYIWVTVTLFLTIVIVKGLINQFGNS